jgi:hypothetical protein
MRTILFWVISFQFQSQRQFLQHQRYKFCLLRLTPGSPKINPHFRGICRLYLQGWRISQARNQPEAYQSQLRNRYRHINVSLLKSNYLNVGKVVSQISHLLVSAVCLIFCIQVDPSAVAIATSVFVDASTLQLHQLLSWYYFLRAVTDGYITNLSLNLKVLGFWSFKILLNSSTVTSVNFFVIWCI